MGPMLTNDYLTPAQRAAAYQVLSQIPGLRVVPHAATILGRTGVGSPLALRYRAQQWQHIHARL